MIGFRACFVSEMTYIVSSGALNSTHSLTQLIDRVYVCCSLVLNGTTTSRNCSLTILLSCERRAPQP